MIVDMIVTNAKVLTMDPARPRAEAVALDGGQIIAVGSRAEIEARVELLRSKHKKVAA